MSKFFLSNHGGVRFLTLTRNMLLTAKLCYYGDYILCCNDEIRKELLDIKRQQNIVSPIFFLHLLQIWNGINCRVLRKYSIHGTSFPISGHVVIIYAGHIIVFDLSNYIFMN